MRSRGASFSAWGSVLFVAAAYVATLCVIETRGLWITDNAVRFVQLQAILDSGFTDYSLPWPGRAVDPEYRFSPLPPNVTRIRDGKLYASYPPAFATMSAVPYALFGMRGLYILPAASAILALVGLVQLAEVIALPRAARYLAVLIAGLCTPMWFYSAVFWESATAACLCVWAIVFCRRFLRDRSVADLVFAGASAAAGIWFRNELLLFCALLTLATMAAADRPRWRVVPFLLAGMLAALVPLWLFQWKAVGSPLGLHFGSNVPADRSLVHHMQGRWTLFYEYFFAAGYSQWISVAMTAPAVLLLATNPRLRGRAFAWAVPACGLASVGLCAAISVSYRRSELPGSWPLDVNSLFGGSPLLIVAFLRPRDAEGEPAAPALRWLWRLLLAYAVLYAMTSPVIATASCLHWGNRYLLPLYPLLSVLAAANLARWVETIPGHGRLRVGVAAMILLASALLQVLSLRILHGRQDFSYRLNRTLNAQEAPVIITGFWWLSQDAFTEFYRRPLFLARTLDDLNALTERLRSHGYREALIVTGPSEDPDVRPVARVEDRGLRTWKVDVFRGPL